MMPLRGAGTTRRASESSRPPKVNPRIKILTNGPHGGGVILRGHAVAGSIQVRMCSIHVEPLAPFARRPDHEGQKR